jgi:hypothetical protein
MNSKVYRLVPKLEKECNEVLVLQAVGLYRSVENNVPTQTSIP